MSWVLALLAFAGVMAMLSTSVSVAVEAVHKMFGLRRAGLEEMLRALHVDVVSKLPGAGLDADDPRRATEAVRFAKTMIKSPSFGGEGRWWWARNIPGLNHIYQPRFERLSTLQYIEQLAQTPVGASLAQANPEKLKHAVHTLAYQFERYGQAQSDYFGRRAKVISALVALAVVVGGNVNALAIYSHLANSPGSLTSALSFFETRNVSALSEDVSAAQEKLVRLEERARMLSTQLAPDQASLSAMAAQVSEARMELSSLQTQLGDANTDARGLSALNLPVGPAQFPFCARIGAEAVDGAGAGACGEALTGLLGRGVEAETFAPSDGFLSRAGSVGGRLLTWEGVGWIFSIIVTTGLVSLGAPFWFDLFRRLGAMVGRTKLTAAVDRQREAEAAASAARAGVRNASANDVDQLTQALLTAAGKGPTPIPPTGQRYGRSTVDMSPDLQTDPGDGPPTASAVGMRQLRG